MDFSNLFQLLQSGDLRQFGGNLALLLVARVLLLPTLTTQLQKIQQEVASLAAAFSEMKETLAGIESNHSLRISKLEVEMKELNHN